MQISQRSRNTIGACRFCWMCRHICPIGNATGKERNNARARALSLSMVERGAVDLTVDITDNLYECALCSACTEECKTGFDPIKFTKEARLKAVLNGLIPEYIDKILSDIENTGNPYGVIGINGTLQRRINEHADKKDNLFFLGQDVVYKNPDSAINAIILLENLGIDFSLLSNEPDSGYTMDFLFGASEETRQLMLNTAATLDFKTVIVYDPCDAKVFLREYKEWGIELNCEVITFTAFLSNIVNVTKTDRVITFQDPPQLARDLNDIVSARMILKNCGNFKEMMCHGKDTVFAGSLLMNEYMPEVMRITSKERWRQALITGADILVTASPSDYVLLKMYNDQNDNMELLTIEEMILKCL